MSFPENVTPLSLRGESRSDREALSSSVRSIVDAVRAGGDAAVIDLTRRFDGASMSTLRVPVAALESSVNSLQGPLRSAIEVAIGNITRFHESQRRSPYDLETTPGVRCGRMVRPIDSVGLYVPGGSAPLFSSLLMLGIPARLAGCPRVVVCTPPNPSGRVDDTILAVAALLGIGEVYAVGGAQAIAAMAYGTESIPSVGKIFGPGNRYVDEAKRMVSQDGIGIDLPAGPSELLIIADESADPSFVAADLLAQAEHGPDSLVVVVSWRDAVIERISQEIDRQISGAPRREVMEASLSRGAMVRVADIEAALEFSNSFAPEHLSLQCGDAFEVLQNVHSAGSVFVGARAAEAFGDYISGTNHTLPTGGAARAFSGVSLESFQKGITWQSLSEEGMRALAPHAALMARAEGLEAHARSVLIRMGNEGWL